MSTAEYYVYVYIDPRNFEEFYYGKGKGARRFAHLLDKSDSEKVARIEAIKAEGMLPIIRTVAAGLTESEAHLIETTLIWKLGRGLTNRAAGKFVSLFRRHNTMHKELSGFDYQNGIYYFNVGESEHRNWEDCRKYGFLAAGHGPQWRDQLLDLVEGDVLVAYVAKHGYVGVGKILERAVPYSRFHIDGLTLREHGLKAKTWDKSDDLDMCEYLIRVKWIASVSRDDAKWTPKSGLFTTQLIRASLDNQKKTIAYVEESFNVNLNELAD